MDWVSNIAARAENLLESVDRSAARTAQNIKQTPQRRVIEKAAETAKRLESRPRYVPRKQKSRGLSPSSNIEGDDMIEEDKSVLSRSSSPANVFGTQHSRASSPAVKSQHEAGSVKETLFKSISQLESSVNNISSARSSPIQEDSNSPTSSIDQESNSTSVVQPKVVAALELNSPTTQQNIENNEWMQENTVNPSTEAELRVMNSELIENTVTIATEQKGRESLLRGEEYSGAFTAHSKPDVIDSQQQDKGQELQRVSNNTASTFELPSNVTSVDSGMTKEHTSLVNEATYKALTDKIEEYERKIAMLEQDIDQMDGQMMHMQSDLDAAQESLLRSQEVCAEREQSLKNALESRNDNHALKEKELMTAVRDRDQRIIQLEEEIDGLQEIEHEMKNEQDAFLEEIQSLKRIIEDVETDKKVRSTDAAELLEDMQDQQNEIREKLLQRDHQIKDLQERENELERSNAELSYALGEAQRQLEEAEGRTFDAEVVASGNYADGHGDMVDSGHDLEVYEALEAKKVIEGMLDDEREKLQTMRMEVSTLNDLLAKSRARAEQWEDKYHATLRKQDEEKQSLSNRINELENQRATEGTAALEKRLYALTEHLSSKQQIIDELTSEKGAVQQRLRNMEKQYRAQQALVTRAEFGGDDLEDGQGLRYRATSTAGVTEIIVGSGRRRGTRSGMRRLARLNIIAQHENLQKAADVLDRVCATLGALLYRQPWARLAFVGYILLMHIWVFYVIEFHTREMHGNDLLQEVLQLKEQNQRLQQGALPGSSTSGDNGLPIH